MCSTFISYNCISDPILLVFRNYPSSEYEVIFIKSVTPYDLHHLTIGVF